MRVLAFDTSMSACSVALWHSGKVLAETTNMMVHGQAEMLLPAVEQVLKESALTYADLDRIAVTVGPGSFTGVRVGLSAARGLGAAAELPVIGIRSTEVIAWDAQREKQLPVAVAIDARRAEVYLHCFTTDGQQIDNPSCLLPEEAAEKLEGSDWVLAGDGAEAVLNHMRKSHPISETRIVNAATLAAMAAERSIPNEKPLPTYVRPPDAIIPRHGGQLRP